MTTAGFRDVVAAMTASTTRPDPVPPTSVTVLGSGVEGRVLAAWFLAEGVEQVRLFTVYADEFEALRRGTVTLRGEGPIGTFRANISGSDTAGVGGDGPAIQVTSVLDTAVSDADLIVVTGPVLKQRTYGLVLADHLRDGQIILVAPGGTFGALEVASLVRAAGSVADVVFVDAPSLPFDIIEGQGEITINRRRPVPIGASPQRSMGAVERLRRLFPEFQPVGSVLDSSLRDGTGLVEVPALLVGGPAAEPEQTRVPAGAHRVNARTFRELIGTGQRNVIERMADERRSVARQFGVRDLPDTDVWIDDVAGDDTESTRPAPSREQARRTVRNAVLGSLVPLVSAAAAENIEVPVTSAMIALAEAVLATPLVGTGRSLASIGFAGADANLIRTSLATSELRS